LTKSFVSEVKGLHEDTEGPIASDCDSDIELDEGKVQSDEEDRPLAVVIGKVQAKRARK
jgi:hypothetical protein